MPSHLESLNNYPTWYTDYGESPTSSSPTSRDVIYDTGYNPDKVMAEFGEMFEDYDPTREQFAQSRLQSQEQATRLNYEQNVDQAERARALAQAQLGDTGFLSQALDRQQRSLDIQQADTLGAQQRLEGYTDPETGEQVMGARQIAGEQVGIQRGLTQAEQGFAEREFGIAGRRLGLEEQGIEAGAAQQQAALRDRMASVGTEQAEAMRRAGVQEAGVGREEERLALAEAGARAESEFALGRLGREREELGLQEQQAQLARSGVDLEGREIGIQRQLSEEERGEIDIQRQLSGVERDELGIGLSEIEMQRQMSDIQRGQFGLQRETSALEQQEAEAGMAQLQAQMGQQVAGARRGMMQAYQAGEADTSGFAGAGARDVAQQRAIQGYAGDAAAGIQGLRARGESLRRGMGRFDIAGRGIGLEEQKFDVGAGRFGLAEERLGLAGERLDIGEGRFDIAERKLDIGAGRYDIAEERLDLKRGELDIGADRRGIGEQALQAQEAKEKADLERQLSQYDVTARDLAGRREDVRGGLATQQQRFAQQQKTINRQVGEVAATEARQMTGVGLTRQAQQAGYDRKKSQLGGQLSGYDLQDASDRLRFDEQGGRLRSQAEQLGIQGEGALARFQEQEMGVKSRLGGVEAQLGEEGFLQRGLQNTLGQMGGRFAEEVYGLRDQYSDEVRNRILDLIRDEGIDASYKSGDPDYEAYYDQPQVTANYGYESPQEGDTGPPGWPDAQAFERWRAAGSDPEEALTYGWAAPYAGATPGYKGG